MGFFSFGALILCLLVPRLTWQASSDCFSLIRVLVSFTYSGLCSYLMLGNLLNCAWVPVPSGGMTLALARGSVTGQYIVHPSNKATGSTM